MVGKINGLLKMGWYKLLYGGRVHFANIPSLRHGARIKCKGGSMHAGRHFCMNNGAYCAAIDGGKLLIADNVSINCNTIVVCHDSVSIGKGCAIAPNVLIYDHDHKFGANGKEKGFRTAPISIGDNCWIGAGVIVLRGTTIGEGSVIGAGTVVSGQIPPFSLVTGTRNMVIQPLEERNSRE